MPSPLMRSIFLILVLLLPSSLSFTTLPSLGPRKVNGIEVKYGSSSSLAIFGPKQALAIEKKKNPAKFESTIAGLMKSKKLTLPQAEKRYGEFLIDPDGFALRAGEAARKEAGYKDWEEAAIARSDNPDETRDRIAKFKSQSQFKALAVIAVFSAALLWASENNKTYSFGGVVDSPTSNPYREFRIKEDQRLRER